MARNRGIVNSRTRVYIRRQGALKRLEPRVAEAEDMFKHVGKEDKKEVKRLQRLVDALKHERDVLQQRIVDRSPSGHQCRKK